MGMFVGTVLKTIRNPLLPLAVGLAPALFLVGPLVFADGEMAERAFLYALTVLAYVLLGFVVGLVWPEKPLARALWLPLPGVLVSVLFLYGEVRELSGVVLIAGLLAPAVLGALLGALAGARVRRRNGRGQRRSWRRPQW